MEHLKIKMIQVLGIVHVIGNAIRGQSYKDLYTLGQIYKPVLKHENNVLAQTFVCRNVRTLTYLQDYIFICH